MGLDGLKGLSDLKPKRQTKTYRSSEVGVEEDRWKNDAENNAQIGDQIEDDQKVFAVVFEE